MENTFDSDLIYSIFKLAWSRKTPEKSKEAEPIDTEVARASKKNRSTTANSNALTVSCELLRIFVTEAVERAAIIAEAEGNGKIEATHLERILPQLLLDF
ncbi:hypothetical protein KFK09_016159 [Dendrobium nobile]|uniref:Centromere protein X n=1 Tax=Dendrobium nobile TaxID=94219 RepID=A0A8T3AX94_DENNO|nr:hypothetical protein KFK09_016159 [Dendrobium nobile]